MVNGNTSSTQQKNNPPTSNDAQKSTNPDTIPYNTGMDYNGYLSPFSWRYGSQTMRHLWSEHNKRLLWRQMWLALAEVQAEFGLVTVEQVADIRAHAADVDIQRSLEIEAEIRHDLMAEIKAFAEQCPVGGGVIHLGATSVDIQDNTDALRLRQAAQLLIGQLAELLTALAEKIELYTALPVMAYTHIQPAEPTTLGYRLAFYAQDLLEDYRLLMTAHEQIRGKGFKGAVGTSASYARLLGEENLPRFEQSLSRKLGLPFYDVTTQTAPRKQEYRLVSALAGIGASLYKLAFDLRILQSPPFGELSEPFGDRQVGSSAMPFKRNPVNAEKLDSLGRELAGLPRLAWDNAAHSLLERTLDDSANRRTLLPEAFLLADEMLAVSARIVRGLQVNQEAIDRNLATYGPFAATEGLLMELVRAGADRQAMHERIREQTMLAWRAVQNGKPNPLAELMTNDAELQRYLPQEELARLMAAESHTGDTEARARKMAERVRKKIAIPGQE